MKGRLQLANFRFRHGERAIAMRQQTPPIQLQLNGLGSKVFGFLN